jgi:hypothetical protein
MSPSYFHGDPRLTLSGHSGWWPRPTIAMDLPRCLKDLVYMPAPLPRLERAVSPVGCSSAPRRPSPCDRRVGSSEKLSRPAQGSLAFRPAHLHLGCAEDFSGGFSRTITRARLLQWLPGEPTIARTGLAPAGLRDPGGLSAILTSGHVRPPFVSHCHPLLEVRSIGQKSFSVAPQPVARHPLPLLAGHLEHFAMELDPVSSLVGRGNLPHPGLKVGDGGLGQADRLGDWIGGHWEIVWRANCSAGTYSGTLFEWVLRQDRPLPLL